MSETELGYKQTKIGKLPNDWEVSKLSDVCEIKGGKRLPKGYELQEHKNNIPYIRVADMYMGGICLDNIKYVPAEIADKIKNYKISSKDLFISVAGTLGIVGEVPEELDGANLTENADKLCNIKIDKKYLLNVLQSEVIQTIILSEMTNNAQPKLALTRIKEFLIPIPSIEEQEKIAEILSTWDSAIEKQEQLIEKKKEFKKGLMQRLLSGEVRFNKDNGESFPEWHKVKLGEYLIKHNEKSEFNNQYPVLTSSRKGIFLQSDYYAGNDVASDDTTGYNVVPRGYFTYRHMSDDLIFKFNINDIVDKGIVSTLYPVFTVKNMDSYFLRAKLNEGDEFKRFALAQKQGGSRTYMYFSKLESLQMNIPSLEEQEKISEVLKLADKEIELLEKELEALKLQKKGLMQRLLTGEVRVKV
ncbi:restriction endonuclease subunit S [Clostridium sp. D43t1_170807_H7]|uniref:restriction endonuclease subunit S n=1 Tax=Clostridium sp. D43t1_170807_H7 TaxID=2787140 RepID=UPI001898D04C|nr:restriction endonuclease subunit S [Clostridium sp. D43t1_170807_H7]